LLVYLFKHTNKCANLTDVCQYPMNVNCCSGEYLYSFQKFQTPNMYAHGNFYLKFSSIPSKGQK